MRNLADTPYGQFIWWIGLVEDTFDDPEKLGRVRVRIFGFHPAGSHVLTEELPLAPVMNGGTAKINSGEMVLGFFMDGSEAQQPFILGTIGTSVQSSSGRFFGSFQQMFSGLSNAASELFDIPDTATDHKPAPVPGGCITPNLDGSIVGGNGNLDTSTLVRVGTDSAGRPALLVKEAAESYLAMVAAAQRDGVSWVINDSYRTFDRQVKEKAASGALAATAGKSNHGCGLAVDLGVQIFDKKEYHWLMKNAEKFGFKRIYLNGRGPQVESWHWEYTLRSNKPASEKHTPETSPDGTTNIYGEEVSKKPTIIGGAP